MKGFFITAPNLPIIRFSCYMDAAPSTSESFLQSLPFSITFFHARLSGQEIWTDAAPKLEIPQENSSILAEPGEIVIGPIKPVRNKVAGLMGIFYGEGKLVDGGNIFGKVFDEDMSLLKTLGEQTWRKGGQELSFETF